MKTTIYVSMMLLMSLSMAGQEYKLKGNFIYDSKTYSLSTNQDVTNKNYTIKISRASDTAKPDEKEEEESKIALVYEVYNEAIFINTVESIMKRPKLVGSNFVVNQSELKITLSDIYKKIYKELNNKDVITELYDNQDIEYSSKVALNKDAIPLTFSYYGNDQLIKKGIKRDKKMKNKKNGCIKKVEINKKKDSLLTVYKVKYKFTPQSASIRFFNNRVNKITVVGKVCDSILKSDKLYTITNNTFSIPFRYLIKKGGILPVIIDGYTFDLECDDLLDLFPNENEYSYSVKNKSYELRPNQPIKVESRNLFDYFTGVVFSDFLGLNNSNNNLLNLEGRIVVPLALVNKGRFNMPEYFEAYVNTTLSNNQDPGIGEILWDSNAKTKIPLFDFFKKRNIEAGLNLGLLSFEWRGISSTFTLDYGAQFYRTKLHQKKSAIDTTTAPTNSSTTDPNQVITSVSSFNTLHSDAIDETVQMYAIGHGPKLKIEIRPQVNFGADLNIGLLGYNYNGLSKNLTTAYNTTSTTTSTATTSNNGVGTTTITPNTPLTTTLDFKHDILEYSRTFYNTFYIVSNFYTKLNSKETNGGLYFRLGAYYDFNTYTVSPQIMAGYATNLTSFINKFKSKNEIKTTP